MVRSRAIWAVDWRKPSLPALFTALQDADSRVSIAAAIVLGKLGDQATIAPLIVAVRDPGEPRAIEPLREVLTFWEDPKNAFLRIWSFDPDDAPRIQLVKTLQETLSHLESKR